MKLLPQKTVNALLLGMFVSAVLTYAIAYVRLHDPNESFDPQGGSSFFCEDTELSSADNHENLMMTARRTNCDIIGNSSFTYVYLYHKNTKYSRVNLVLRYDGGEPSLSWTDPKRAVITASYISQVDKEVTRLFGVSISYNLSEVN